MVVQISTSMSVRCPRSTFFQGPPLSDVELEEARRNPFIPKAAVNASEIPWAIPPPTQEVEKEGKNHIQANR